MHESRHTKAAGLQEALKQKVLASYQRLPLHQKKVADYFLQRPNDLAFLTTEAVAVSLGVSKATIVRFAQRLGYSGFTELRNEALNAVHSKIEPADRFIVAMQGHSADEALELVARHEVQNINQTIQRLERRTLGEVVNLIANAARVYTMGIGISSLLAQILAYELNQVTVDAQPLSSGSMRFVEHLLLATTRDLIIGFSFPPYSRETVQAAAAANERGIPVVAITDKLASPITFHATKVLPVHTANMLYTNSISAISVVINTLVTELAIQRKPAVAAMLRESSRRLQQLDEFVGENGG
jgi:DNA-binding MurR/RpiR family transcriptional regulator